MAGSPENKIRLLGKEVDPGYIGVGGWVLTIGIGGILAGNEPCIAVPAITVGLASVVYSIRKMEQESQKTPPS